MTHPQDPNAQQQWSQYPPSQQGPFYPPEPVNPEKNGLGIAAIILGPIGILLALVPLTGWLAIIVGFIGFCLGLAGILRVKRKKASNPATAAIGTILSIVAIIAGFYAMVTFFNIVDDFGNDMEEIGNKWDSYSECVENADGDLNALSECEYEN